VNAETEEALRALDDYKETVNCLERELNTARDVENTHTQQVTL